MMGKPIATQRTVMGVSTGKLAVWWLIVSEIVIFGGVLASYIMHRIGYPEWAASAAHTASAIVALRRLWVPGTRNRSATDRVPRRFAGATLR